MNSAIRLEDDISILPVAIKPMNREDTDCGAGNSRCFSFQITSLQFLITKLAPNEVLRLIILCSVADATSSFKN
jgi:hypothetical protein